MEIADHFVFRCTQCGSRIPWRLSAADIGIAAGEEPEGGKIYPFEKCFCSWGRFIQCEDQRSRGKRPEADVPADAIIRSKIDAAVYQKLPLASVHPNPKQPRRFFDQIALKSLADSLASIGLLEDILVRKNDQGTGYEIVMGERRWRAAQIAALERISCKIVELTNEEAKLLSLVENVQRENLTDVEEAFSFKEFIDRGSSAKDVGTSLGKMTDRVAGKLRLLSTPQYIKFQEARIQELTGDNERLKAALLVAQGENNRKYTSRVLRSEAELLNAINEGWEFVAQLQNGSFLVRRLDDNP